MNWKPNLDWSEAFRLLQEARRSLGEARGSLEREGLPIVLSSTLAVVLAASLGAGFLYGNLCGKIDRRLAAGPFADTVNIYSAAQHVAVGDPLTLDEIVARLRRSGYTGSPDNPIGRFHIRSDCVEIFPGREAKATSEPATLCFSHGALTRIVSLADKSERTEYLLEAQFIANVSKSHEQRSPVRFAALPPALIHAVVSAEDKRFFQHGGVDLLRTLKAAYVDLRVGRKEQGASTLSMQLVRELWLGPDKSWVRKAEEVLITLHLEEKLSKQQIFEDYANEIYLGRQGPFSINGFGEAARVYFGKQVSQLNNAEAALLAGMVQRPSYYNPYRYPERARERRNHVLALMRENGYLNAEEYRRALAAPLNVSKARASLDASYFLDVLNEDLQTKVRSDEHAPRYVYTTLDPDLQVAAEEAVRVGMEDVDRQLRRQRHHRAIPPGEPQVALVALDPHTGEVKALVGGRSYGTSQYDRVLAMRQPGSVFKPFVYAAALDTAVSGGARVFTPDSTVDDSPTTFHFGNKTYTPGNFGNVFHGQVTLRDALAHSLNVATVKLAEAVGYDKVVEMARKAGLNHGIQPTPAVALGAYETTPLEIAGAYTTFANEGRRVSPTTISVVRANDGKVIYLHTPDPRRVLDPRINYLMVNMLEEVLNSGTAAGVRSRGFTLPAAAKTGTSRDGWFAGFTSELLCVVWVGFDDNRDLDMEGARSALPIWTEFMKRAARFHTYHEAKPFTSPSGLVSVRVCADSGQLAGPACPRPRSEVFLAGTQPRVQCQLHTRQTQAADRVGNPPGGGRTDTPHNSQTDIPHNGQTEALHSSQADAPHSGQPGDSVAIPGSVNSPALAIPKGPFPDVSPRQ